MGTAGLDIRRLAGLLERLKVEAVLAHDDRAGDHCVLRLCSVKRPDVVALVQYENMGFEPRNVGMMLCTAAYADEMENRPSEWQYHLRLSGGIKDDPEKIAEWIVAKYLESPHRPSL